MRSGGWGCSCSCSCSFEVKKEREERRRERGKSAQLLSFQCRLLLPVSSKMNCSFWFWWFIFRVIPIEEHWGGMTLIIPAEIPSSLHPIDPSFCDLPIDDALEFVDWFCSHLESEWRLGGRDTNLTEGGGVQKQIWNILLPPDQLTDLRISRSTSIPSISIPKKDSKTL